MLVGDWYARAPWMVACPVVPSHFVPLFSEHACYNVQTDAAAIGAYGGHLERYDPSAFLFSDLQTQTGFHECGRLGSGRTGFYQGAYLKGVGRTPLAMNWWRFADRFHATGHLSASCAIREWVVSCYFAAKGRAHLINACDGLLVGELVPSLREARSWRRWKDEECTPCDLRLQAITVKPADFTRLSNHAWHLSHLSLANAEDDLIRFFEMLMRGIAPDEPVDLGSLLPSVIVRALVSAVDRTIANYREYFRMGVTWMTPYNNFTLDGRFCDLDFPVFNGPGYVGLFPSLETWGQDESTVHVPEDADFGLIFGLNVLPYLHQTRTALRFIRSGLEALLRSEFPYANAERDFVAGFLSAFDEGWPPDHPLWSGAACARMLEGWIADECEMTNAARADVQALVDRAVELRLEHRTIRGMSVRVERVDLACARAGASPTLTTSAYALAGCRVRPERLEEARFLNEWVARLDAVSDRDELLAGSLDAAVAIQRYCAGPVRH